MKKIFVSLMLVSALARAEATPKVTDLAWLAGSWAADSGMEAIFTDPKGDLILSTWKQVVEGKVEFYELEVIQQQGDKVELVPYPFGTRGVSFKATKIDDAGAVFENPEHDFPSKITYTKASENRIDVSVEGRENGAPVKLEFALKRR